MFGPTFVFIPRMSSLTIAVEKGDFLIMCAQWGDETRWDLEVFVAGFVIKRKGA